MVNNKINVNVIDGLQPILDRIIDYDNITNCITEIPQDIKLELNNGTLTLKAGSKVYVPNGAGKFDEVVISGDKTVTGFTTGADNVQFLLFINSINQSPYCFRVQDCYSGSTAPTATVGNMMWYDTSNNIIQNSADQGSTWGNIWGLPLAVVTASSKVVTFIDQVFNGFGYIGSTVFALPGVKGLIPNGRNEDGTLKNIEFVNDVVRAYTGSWTDGNHRYIYASKNFLVGNIKSYTYIQDEKPTAQAGNVYWINYKDNLIRYTNNQGATWSVVDYALVGEISSTNGVITSFTPKLPFRAVDQNDFNKLDEEVVKTSGYQIINGDKIFTGQIIKFASSSTPMMTSRQNHVTLGTNPSANANTYIANEDKSGADQSYINFEVRTDGSGLITIAARNNSSSDRAGSGIQVARNLDGTSWTHIGTTTASAPTPETTDNSTKIATTAWVNNKHQVVSALPSSPIAGVFYFIKE